MATKEELTQLVIDGKLSVVDFICETTEQTYRRAQEKSPDILWSMDAVLAHWQMIRDAHKNGKKVIFFGGPVPIDIPPIEPWSIPPMPLPLAGPPSAISFLNTSSGVVPVPSIQSSRTRIHSAS